MHNMLRTGSPNTSRKTEKLLPQVPRMPPKPSVGSPVDKHGANFSMAPLSVRIREPTTSIQGATARNSTSATTVSARLFQRHGLQATSTGPQPLRGISLRLASGFSVHGPCKLIFQNQLQPSRLEVFCIAFGTSLNITFLSEAAIRSFFAPRLVECHHTAIDTLPGSKKFCVPSHPGSPSLAASLPRTP